MAADLFSPYNSVKANHSSAYIDLGLRLKITCAEKSSAWLGRRRRRKMILQSAGNANSCIKPTKVKVISLEIQSEEKAPVLGLADDENDGSFKKLLPPWGSFPDRDSGTQSPAYDHLMISEKNTDTNEDEVCYLEEKNEETLSKRLLKLSRSNKVRSALALCRSMNISGLVPNSHSCNSLLSCLLRNGRLDDALTLFESMKLRDIITGHSYSLILKAVAKFQGCDAALTMFEEAEKEDETTNCIDVIVYNTMIAIFGKEDNWAKAERLWRSLQVNGHKGTVITYRLLICIFVRCGQNELAFDAYHEMVENGITSGNNDAVEAIIGACSKEGKWELALHVLQGMLDSDLKPSLIACNALINSLAKASKVRLAFKVFDLIESFGHKPDSYTWNALLVALNRASRHADALRLFESVRKDHGASLNLHVYNTCLMSCQKLALWDRAVQILQEMEASGFSVSVTSYNLVIGACEAARKPEIAWQVYEHMIELNHSPDVFTLLTLTRCCIWGSLWNEVEEILSTSPNGSLYNTAIQGMCLRNKTDLARKLYEKMREIGLKPDGKTRSLMLQKLPNGISRCSRLL